MKSITTWQGNMKFTAIGNSGHEVVMDAAPDMGGENTGNRPKEMVVHGLAGCTAMDVISILKKMRIEPKSFRVEVKVRQTEEHPKIFDKIHLKYFFSGDLPEDKVKKAIELSQEKYCGVSEMLRRSGELTYEYFIES